MFIVMDSECVCVNTMSCVYMVLFIHWVEWFLVLRGAGTENATTVKGINH